MISDELNALNTSRVWSYSGSASFNPGPLSVGNFTDEVNYPIEPVPIWLVAVHLTCGVVLLGLNYWWFGLIIRKAFKAFDVKKEKTKTS